MIQMPVGTSFSDFSLMIGQLFGSHEANQIQYFEEDNIVTTIDSPFTLQRALDIAVKHSHMLQQELTMVLIVKRIQSKQFQCLECGNLYERRGVFGEIDPVMCDRCE